MYIYNAKMQYLFWSSYNDGFSILFWIKVLSICFCLNKRQRHRAYILTADKLNKPLETRAANIVNTGASNPPEDKGN